MARKSGDEHGPRNKVLLVERPDDLYCIGELLQARNVVKGQSCNIKAAEGFSRLREDFAVRLRVASNTGELRQFLGVVADADKNPQEHWDALRNLMAANGYTNLPAALPPFGYSHPASDSPAGQPLVALWLMPGDGGPGALEDDALWAYAEEVVANLPRVPKETPEGEERWRSKARIHSYLAWQEKPGYPIGSAIKSRFLSSETDAAKRLTDWLIDFFELPILATTEAVQ